MNRFREAWIKRNHRQYVNDDYWFPPRGRGLKVVYQGYTDFLAGQVLVFDGGRVVGQYAIS